MTRCRLIKNFGGRMDMDGENKKIYFNLFIGYLGLLLIGISVFRRISDKAKDPMELGLIMFGYLLISNYFQFAENKIGIPAKVKIIFRLSFIVILLIFGFYIYREL